MTDLLFTGKDSLRYLDEEVTVPDGMTVEDFDWTGFTWAVDDDSSNRFIQFILIPGALLLRTGGYAPGSKYVVSVRIVFRSGRNLMEEAMTQTEDALGGGYEWKCPPKLFTMDPDDYPLWPKTDILEDPDRPGTTIEVPVRTLGDALVATRAARLSDPQGDIVNASIAVL